MNKLNLQDTAQLVLDKLKNSGATKSATTINKTTKYELNVEADKVSLYRTTENVSVSMKALVNTKRGITTTNNTNVDSLEENAKNAVLLANASEEDDGNDISPGPLSDGMVLGASEPNSDEMYDRFSEFLDYVRSNYPTIKLDQCILSFDLREKIYANTNGVYLTEKIGAYSFGPMFFAKDANGTSSFNYAGATHLDLSTKLKDWGGLDQLMKEATEQTKTERLGQSFVGDIILTPQSAIELLMQVLNSFLDDMSIITDSSIWKDKLNEQVASKLLTIKSMPQENGVSIKTFITADGFKTENTTLIDKGVLKSFLLSQYGAKKTNRDRCVSDGEGIIISPGQTPKNKLISNVKKGILLGRFSGGSPSSNGDFSGVAKNSYLIENGVITKPLSETMIAGNLAKLLGDIIGISQESIDFGEAIIPWIHSTGVTISG